MLEIKHIIKRYQYQKVLNDVSMKFPRCGLVSIVGPSGCGKSTLLHIIGGLDREFQGELLWNGKSVRHFLPFYRKKHVSFIFQQFHLIMWLSIKNNIEISHFFSSHSKKENQLDIKSFQKLKMSALSHGQRQRIAYLRACYHNGDILLCDEPTGSLHPSLADEVMALLKKESRKRLVILISHDRHLVEKYSDEIYEMKDGQIENHHVFQHHQFHSLACHHAKRKRLSCLLMSILSFLSHKIRSMQLITGLSLSLLCIVFTLTMSQGLEEQIHRYIYSLVPASGMSFQHSQGQSLTQSFCQELEKLPAIEKVQLYLDDYEFLGIGFVMERYQESEVVFIGDDTSPYQQLLLHSGRMPLEDHEIVVSLSTAQKLCGQEDVSQLVGKKVYAWYQYGYEVKSIAYHIVGISNQTTALETIYQRSNAYIHLLKETYQFDDSQVNAKLGILYVHPDFQRHEVFEQLKEQYPQYRFLEIGASTSQKISYTMKQVEFVLMVFSGLAMISSLFLIGEVMFLNVVQKKKDIAIMKCFGATSFDIMKIVLGESFVTMFLAQIVVSFVYCCFIFGVNTILSQVLLIDFSLSIHLRLLFYSYGASYILVFISQLPPLFYGMCLNTIKALK